MEKVQKSKIISGQLSIIIILAALIVGLTLVAGALFLLMYECLILSGGECGI